MCHFCCFYCFQIPDCILSNANTRTLATVVTASGISCTYALYSDMEIDLFCRRKRLALFTHFCSSVRGSGGAHTTVSAPFSLPISVFESRFLLFFFFFLNLSFIVSPPPPPVASSFAHADPLCYPALFAHHVAAPVKLAVAALVARLLQDVVASAAAQTFAVVHARAGLVADATLRSRRVRAQVPLAEIGRFFKVDQVVDAGPPAVRVMVAVVVMVVVVMVTVVAVGHGVGPRKPAHRLLHVSVVRGRLHLQRPLRCVGLVAIGSPMTSVHQVVAKQSAITLPTDTYGDASDTFMT